MSENHSSYAPSRDDEVDLFELFDTLKESWKLWVGSTLAGGVLAFGISQALPSSYEVSSLVRIGSAGPMGQVEPTLVAMERIKSRAFQQAVCDALVCDEEQRDAIKKQITITQPKGTDVLSLTVKADSPARAAAVSEAVVQVLQQTHAELAGPALQNVRRQLTSDQKRLKELEAQRQRVVVQVSRAQGEAAAAVAVLQLAQMGDNSELQVLSQRVADLAASLEAPKTRPTERLQKLYVSDKPVSPRKSLITIVGSILGAFIGVSAVFVMPAWRNRKRQAHLKSM